MHTASGRLWPAWAAGTALQAVVLTHPDSDAMLRMVPEAAEAEAAGCELAFAQGSELVGRAREVAESVMGGESDMAVAARLWTLELCSAAGKLDAASRALLDVVDGPAPAHCPWGAELAWASLRARWFLHWGNLDAARDLAQRARELSAPGDGSLAVHESLLGVVSALAERDAEAGAHFEASLAAAAAEGAVGPLVQARLLRNAGAFRWLAHGDAEGALEAFSSASSVVVGSADGAEAAAERAEALCASAAVMAARGSEDDDVVEVLNEALQLQEAHLHKQDARVARTVAMLADQLWAHHQVVLAEGLYRGALDKYAAQAGSLPPQQRRDRAAALAAYAKAVRTFEKREQEAANLDATLAEDNAVLQVVPRRLVSMFCL